MAKTNFEVFLSEALDEQKGIYFPVKASARERMLVKKVSINQLHPNADDEFCKEDVGPSYRIIMDYVDSIRKAIDLQLPKIMEPITVIKTKPSGYLILNGHHRWAAALRLGIKKVPIEIINLAQLTDIQKTIKNSPHEKRAVFDLDEVIIRPDDDPFVEKALGFPYNIRYMYRIRVGVPALFYHLKKHGYDIWLYTGKCYSVDDLMDFFRCCSASVDGIRTALGMGGSRIADQGQAVERLLAEKYSQTINVDNDSVVLIRDRRLKFEEFKLSGKAATWSGEVLDILKGIEDEEV